MSQGIDEGLVAKAIKIVKKGTVMGMDGCPYELWKMLDERYQKPMSDNQEKFNVMKTMALVFQDLQTNRAHEKVDFALGWMCPIYKKKDRTEISNYRPVMLMNMDYKLLTKVMALQLLDSLHQLVHRDQTGFILNRSIFHNIRLTRAIIDHAEATEKDGAIIALDQEKAYDKIKHDYLWKMLESFGIPQSFIKTAKELHKHATTTVAVNGCMSKTFQVTRGVQQVTPYHMHCST